MISAAGGYTAALAARLAAKAAALAQAAAENRVRSRRADGSRWRKARLIWPLFPPEK